MLPKVAVRLRKLSTTALAATSTLPRLSNSRAKVARAIQARARGSRCPTECLVSTRAAAGPAGPAGGGASGDGDDRAGVGAEVGMDQFLGPAGAGTLGEHAMVGETEAGVEEGQAENEEDGDDGDRHGHGPLHDPAGGPVP